MLGKKIKWAIIVFLFSVISCQKNRIQEEVIVWKKGQSSVILDQINATEKKEKTKIANISGVQISRYAQTFKHLSIDGSEIKIVKNKEKTTYAVADHFLAEDRGLEDKNSDNIDSFKKLNTIEKIKLNSGEKILQQEYLWMPIVHRLTLALAVIVEDRHHAVWKKYFRYGVLVKKNQMGSHFHQAQVSVFPKGPKLSGLIDDLLEMNLNSPVSFSNLLVVSDSRNSINEINQKMKFPLNDERFDQLQVYYYLKESLDWLAKKFGFETKSILKARVHVDSPEKSNIMYYFNSEIRLGDGDDDYYSKIPRDASIVIHESIHFLIDQLSGLPFDGEGGSLNEAIADFLTCMQLNRPFLAENSFLKASYKRRIDTILTWDQRNGGLYHDSAIISSLLWDMKETFGDDIALNILKKIIIKLHSRSDFEHFKNLFLEESVLAIEKTQTDLFQMLLDRHKILQVGL